MYRISTAVTAAAITAAVAAFAVQPVRAGTMHDVVDSLLTPAVQGSGRIGTQTRQVGAFLAVASKGGIDVDVVVGPQPAVTVEADDNLFDAVHTEVQGDTLVVGTKGSWHTAHAPVVHIAVPQLQALQLAGSGNASIKGLAAERLKLDIEGSGEITAAGRVQHLQLSIAGSGDAHLAALDAAEVQARIDGSGDAELSASQALDAVVNGSGDVRYGGNPSHLNTQVHGSGEIARR